MKQQATQIYETASIDLQIVRLHATNDVTGAADEDPKGDKRNYVFCEIPLKRMRGRLWATLELFN